MFIYFYTGTLDPFFRQNVAFANELTSFGIEHRFFEVNGGHLWRLWRRQMVPALLATSEHVSDATA